MNSSSVSSARRFGQATPNQVLAIVCVGICLANLDLFIVNVGLPDIARDFHEASLDDMSWVLNGYAIAYAALLVFCGRLAERHRRNISFLWGVGLFTLASAACGLATNVESLVLFRVVQAAGAALMTPTSLGLLLASFPPERRPQAVRFWTAMGGLAAALGPVIGGLLVASSWRWIFMVNVPIGVVALVIGYRMLPEVPGHDAPVPSSFAAILISLGIAALVLSIVKGNDWGWASGRVAGSAALGLVCLALFTRLCLRSANPFLDFGLFRIRAFAGATYALAPYSVAFGAMLFSVALWGQSVWHWSALQTGLAIMPGPLLVPLTSLTIGGAVIRRFGPAAVVTVGVSLFTVAMLLYALRLGIRPEPAIVVMGMVLAGIGVGLTFPTLMGTGTAALPPQSLATGSGVINMIRQAALAIGVAIFVAILGPATTDTALVEAFRLGWLVTAAFTASSLIPAVIYLRRGRR